MYLTIGLDKAAGCKLNVSKKNWMYPGLSPGHLHMGGLLMRGDIDLMGGGT